MYLLFVMPSCSAEGAPSTSAAVRPIHLDTSKDRICCLVESRGAAVEIGIASINQCTAECAIGQFADTPTFTGLCRQIELLDPDLVQGSGGQTCYWTRF